MTSRNDYGALQREALVARELQMAALTRGLAWRVVALPLVIWFFVATADLAPEDFAHWHVIAFMMLEFALVVGASLTYVSLTARAIRDQPGLVANLRSVRQDDVPSWLKPTTWYSLLTGGIPLLVLIAAVVAAGRTLDLHTAPAYVVVLLSADTLTGMADRIIWICRGRRLVFAVSGLRADDLMREQGYLWSGLFAWRRPG